MKPAEVIEVASYIVPLRGTKPPNPKPPENLAPGQDRAERVRITGESSKHQHHRAPGKFRRQDCRLEAHWGAKSGACAFGASLELGSLDVGAFKHARSPDKRNHDPRSPESPVKSVDWSDFREHLATADKEGHRLWIYPRKPGVVSQTRAPG